MPGGGNKFVVRRDPVTSLYVALVNPQVMFRAKVRQSRCNDSKFHNCFVHLASVAAAVRPLGSLLQSPDAAGNDQRNVLTLVTSPDLVTWCERPWRQPDGSTYDARG